MNQFWNVKQLSHGRDTVPFAEPGKEAINGVRSNSSYM